MDRDAPIAVMDSGVGGISVLSELVKLMPHENFIYYGDSANAPYGTKNKSVVLDITRRNLEALMEGGAKAAVKEIAKDLIQLYAERQRRPGYSFPADDDFQRDFETAFEYEETDSQLTVTEESAPKASMHR